MDLKTYLKAEFAVCGPLIRELMSFFAGNKEQSMLSLVTSQVRCPSCHRKVRITEHEDGVSAHCSKDPEHISLRTTKKNALLVTLEWMLQRKIEPTEFWQNPWIDSDRWQSRLTKTNVQTADGVAYYIAVIAELKLHHHVWAAHKRTADHHTLSEEDKVVVESIGFLAKLFKQDVMHQLGRSSQFTSLQECAGAISANERAAAVSRFSSWHKFEHELSPEYRQAVWQVLTSLKG